MTGTTRRGTARNPTFSRSPVTPVKKKKNKNEKKNTKKNALKATTTKKTTTTTSTTTKKPAAKKEKKDAATQTTKVPHPCPTDADIPQCKTWCSGVLEEGSFTVVRGGATCSEDSSKPFGPACVCYDLNTEVQLASCASPCSGYSKKHADAKKAKKVEIGDVDLSEFENDLEDDDSLEKIEA